MTIANVSYEGEAGRGGASRIRKKPKPGQADWAAEDLRRTTLAGARPHAVALCECQITAK